MDFWTGCRPCGCGTFQDSGYHREADCIPCPEGQYQNTEGQSNCEACSPGTFTSTTGRCDCDACAKGTYSQSGAANCTGCPPGKYQDETKQVSCKACELHTFTGGYGSESCESCSPGMYQPLPGQNQCVPCQLVWDETSFNGYSICIIPGMLFVIVKHPWASIFCICKAKGVTVYGSQLSLHQSFVKRRILGTVMKEVEMLMKCTLLRAYQKHFSPCNGSRNFGGKKHEM